MCHLTVKRAVRLHVANHVEASARRIQRHVRHIHGRTGAQILFPVLVAHAPIYRYGGNERTNDRGESKATT